MTGAREPLRIAVVGVGPKGLYALERLLSRAAPVGVPLDVRLFEPDPYPGSGPNYSPTSPPYLRMNFAGEQISMWPTGELGADRRRFCEWSGADHRGTDDYPPRASVGRYLNAGFTQLVARAGRAKLSLTPERVERVRPNAEGRWSVVAGSDEHAVDEVVLATGHAQRSRRDLGAHAWSHRACLVPRVFPVESELGEDRIAPGSAVAIRGFALTMIDAALALTEGRGGRFEPRGDGGFMRYIATTREPRAILPYSRTGRPMLAKTGPAWARARGLDRFDAEARDAVLELPDPIDVRRDLLPALHAGAARALAHLRVPRSEAALRRATNALAEGRSLGGGEALVELDRSIAIAAGAATPDHVWALAHAWRSSYPAIVSRLGGSAVDAAQWPFLRRLAAEMERIAFGPPPGNAAKLSALAHAGVVDLRLLRGLLEERPGGTWLADGERGLRIDAVLDAVLPGPGIVEIDHQPLTGLVADGLASARPGRRGLEVTAGATCVGSCGRPTRGLAALGRVTEDWVIGNDTLNRELHDAPDRWARRIIERAASR